MIALLVRCLTEEEARTVAAWAYPPPFDVYDVDPDDPGPFLRRDDEGEGFYPALDAAARSGFARLPIRRRRPQRLYDAAWDRTGLVIDPSQLP